MDNNNVIEQIMRGSQSVICIWTMLLLGLMAAGFSGSVDQTGFDL
jgi:hypothetical protein